MFKIKLQNKISPSGLEKLPAHLYRCNEEIEEPDAILVRSDSMHGSVIPGTVRAIARCGAGTNNIPIDKCSEAGIVVLNTPGANSNAVKEMVIAGLLLSARKMFPAMRWVQELRGRGDEVPALAEAGKARFAGPELKGKKLGVIGLGAVGGQVCNAALSLGMEVYGYDSGLSVNAAWKLSSSIIQARSYKEIYENCDFITLHVPLTPETRGLINSQSIAMMKHGVRILNFSRGEIVDNTDIVAAVEEKQVYCYITDFPSDDILGNYGIIVLPHLASSTPESEENCAQMAAEQIREFLENGNIINSVNLPDVQVDRMGLCRVTLIHRNKPGMISAISGAVGTNIDNLTNKSRGDYAYTLLDLDSGISEDVLERLRAIDGVIRVTVIN